MAVAVVALLAGVSGGYLASKSASDATVSGLRAEVSALKVQTSASVEPLAEPTAPEGLGALPATDEVFVEDAYGRADYDAEGRVTIVLPDGRKVEPAAAALATIKGNGERIYNAAWVHPTDADVVYLVTTTKDLSKPTVVTNRLYAYRLSTGELREMYVETGKTADQPGESAVWSILGRQGSKLIFWVTGVDNSPGPCASLWNSGQARAIDLADASKGWVPYAVPAYKSALEERQSKLCEDEMSR